MIEWRRPTVTVVTQQVVGLSCRGLGLALGLGLVREALTAARGGGVSSHYHAIASTNSNTNSRPIAP